VSQEQGPARGPGSSLVGPRIVAAAFVAFGVVVLVQTLGIREGGGYSAVGPRLFPYIVGAGLISMGLVLLLRTTVRPDRELESQAAEEEAATYWPTLGLVAAALVAYVYLLEPLGYVLATTLFFLAASVVLGSRRLLVSLVVGAGLALTVFEGFTRYLGVQLPGGLLDRVL
jgi:putative tricarboxylic transport membrane protein